MLKEDILKVLAKNRDRAVSGQELAEMFSVSRNAVWKAVKTLESEGVKVSAVTSKGYRLEKNTLCRFDLDLPEDVEIHFFDSVDSTNSEAKRMLAAGLNRRAFIFSNEQTAGRGRCGRDFFSPKNTGLYYSFVFHPKKSFSDAVFITTAAAVSVVRAIEKISLLKPEIKWVNDIYIQNKKVCGILSEAVTDFESGEVHSIIVGIGINFNTGLFPKELKSVAASLNDDSLTRASLLQALAIELIKVSEELKNPDILNDYISHSLVLGKDITFIKNGESHSGKALRIDENGALIVQTEKGEEKLTSGEISLRLASSSK